MTYNVFGGTLNPLIVDPGQLSLAIHPKVLALINEVALHRDWLILGWVTVYYVTSPA